MPYLDSFQQVKYDPSWPYHYLYDNIPIQNLLTIQQIINDAVDYNTYLLESAVGTAGTLDARLSTSLDDNGNLIPSSVDTALADSTVIADIQDQITTISEETTPGATALWISVAPGTPPVIEATIPPDITTPGYLQIQDSETITWSLTSGNPGTSDPEYIGYSGYSGYVYPTVLKAQMALPLQPLMIKHYYGIAPVKLVDNLTGSLFQATSIATEYISGSLRVYINGIRIFSDVGVYVPSNYHGISGYSGYNDDVWYLTSFTEASATTFQLNRTINPNIDTIRIDFDFDLT
jgi:hypothetical protein